MQVPHWVHQSIDDDEAAVADDGAHEPPVV
jgi:hypothetical protein